MPICFLFINNLVIYYAVSATLFFQPGVKTHLYHASQLLTRIFLLFSVFSIDLARLFHAIQILTRYFSLSAFSIDCYVCTSLNGQNQACEDKFQRDLTTSLFINRTCYFAFFKGTHCIKLKGIRGNSRNCSINQSTEITLENFRGKKTVFLTVCKTIK